MSDLLLSVQNLHTRFHTHEGAIHAVDGVSLDVEEGEMVGIVGESGCGKSATALSAMRLESPGEISSGSIRFRGTELTDADDRTLRRVRGSGMSMVFQNPETTLNPVYTVGEQIAESVKIHDAPDEQRLLDFLGLSLFKNWRDRHSPISRAVELMEDVGIPSPDVRAQSYPHELSGGMRQRAMLAVALAGDPDLLIADEPTTALDTTTQAQILAKLREINRERGTAMVLISHDLNVIAELCDRVVVMYAGQVMERGPIERVLQRPSHPYTKALLACTIGDVPRQSELDVIGGKVPDMVGGTTGCPFAPRCSFATDECESGSIPVHPLDTDNGSGDQRVDHKHMVKCGQLDRIHPADNESDPVTDGEAGGIKHVQHPTADGGSVE